MTDNTKLNYLSEWDIDQLDASGEVDNITLTASVTLAQFVTLQTLSLGYPPVVDGTWQVVGDTVWRQFGDPSFSSFWVNAVPLLTCNNTGVYLSYTNFNGSAGHINVRYYVWADKVTY